MKKLERLEETRRRLQEDYHQARASETSGGGRKSSSFSNTAAHSTPFFGQNAHGDGSPVADASRRELADGVLSVHTGGGPPEAEVIATRGLTGSHLLAVDAATAEGVGRLELLDALYRHKLERAIACDSLEDAPRAASERSDVGIFTEEDDCGTVPGNVGIPPSASARCWSPCRASRQ